MKKLITSVLIFVTTLGAVGATAFACDCKPTCKCADCKCPAK